jgi:hypothetical protein
VVSFPLAFPPIIYKRSSSPPFVLSIYLLQAIIFILKKPVLQCFQVYVLHKLLLSYEINSCCPTELVTTHSWLTTCVPKLGAMLAGVSANGRVTLIQQVLTEEPITACSTKTMEQEMVWSTGMVKQTHLREQKLHGLNYIERETAACRRSDCQLLRIEGATWSA